MNPFKNFIEEFVKLLNKAKNYSLSEDAIANSKIAPKNISNGQKVLIFSPHPDDECIIGALPLRLLKSGMQIINVAVTLGSNKARQTERLAELQNACNFIGFDLQLVAQDGFTGVNLKTRAENPAEWESMVNIIAAFIEKEQPKCIFVPHEHDVHPTHIGTHLLVKDALKQLPKNLGALPTNIYIIETEYWQQISKPNLLVESSISDVVDLVTALSFHKGEVARNPYHILLPALMADNVRRGSELVLGPGKKALNINFATLYNIKHWKNNSFNQMFKDGKIILSCDNAVPLFLEELIQSKIYRRSMKLNFIFVFFILINCAPVLSSQEIAIEKIKTVALNKTKSCISYYAEIIDPKGWLTCIKYTSGPLANEIYCWLTTYEMRERVDSGLQAKLDSKYYYILEDKYKSNQ